MQIFLLLLPFDNMLFNEVLWLVAVTRSFMLAHSLSCANILTKFIFDQVPRELRIYKSAVLDGYLVEVFQEAGADGRLRKVLYAALDVFEV